MKREESGNKWYAKNGKDGEIAVSTRVRLARNVAEYPFSGLMTEGQQRELMNRAANALRESGKVEGLRAIEMDKLSATERRALVERHIISPDLADGSGPRGVLVSGDESVCVMIGEEDHLRIQVLGAGLCPGELERRAMEIDDVFDAAFKYAFSEKLGYLTKCPTNLGTGMRVSVMLHLPALAESGALQNLAQSASSLGFAVRGLYGEGSAAVGSMCQISNRTTIGSSEEELCERINDMASQIIEREKKLRISAYERSRVRMEDKIWRSAGAMKYARMVSTSEAMNALSDLRIGVSLGVIDLTCAELNDLLWAVQPASVAVSIGPEKSASDAADRDEARASLLRSALKNI